MNRLRGHDRACRPYDLNRIMPAEGRYSAYYHYRTPASIVFKRKSGCFCMCGEIGKMKTGGCSSQTDAGDGIETAKLPSGDRIEASVALQVLPWVDMEQVVKIVDRVIEYIQSTGVRYVVGPFETTMEGDLDVLLDIVKEAQHIAIGMGAPEVLSMVKIAYRPDAAGSMTIESKTAKYQALDYPENLDWQESKITCIGKGRTSDETGKLYRS